MLEHGAACGSQDQCGFGVECLRDMSMTNPEQYRCVPWGSVDNGVEVQRNKPLICKSGHILAQAPEVGEENERYFCMPGDKSKYDPNEALDVSVNVCLYESFEDPSNPSVSVTHSDSPTCGFNVDDMSYCNA